MFCKAKFLLVNLLLAVLCFQNLYAYDFESDGVYYNIIDNVLKQVEVTHSGNPQNNQYQSGTYYLPDVVRYEDVEYHVTSIGDSAFFSCRVWFSVNLPQSVTRIGNAAFQGSMLQSVNIPESVTSIGNGAFFNCSGLQYVDISSGITSIGDSTFFSCSGLMSVNIPESVTSIGNAAFQGCRALQFVNIPQSVRTIGNAAFSNCMTLETIVSYAQIPPVCGNNTFQGVDKSNCIVRVALSKVDAYKAADTWGEFVNIQGDEALSIDGLYEESSKVDIYNLQGRLLYPKADIEEVKDALPKGIYLLRQGQRTIKVVF